MKATARLLLPVLLAARLAAAVPGDLRRVHGEFECRLGTQWAERDAWPGRYPAYVFSMAAGSRPFPFISVERYDAGNPMYPAPRNYLDYLSRHGGLSRSGQAAVMGRKVQLWAREYEESEGAFDSPKPSSWKAREQLAIVEAPRAFYVLRLKAPMRLYKELTEEFEAFLGSFSLLPKKPEK